MERLLNLQIIFERIQSMGWDAEFVPPSRMPGLKGICFYEGEEREEDFLLVCAQACVDSLPDRGSLLLLGDWAEEKRGKTEGYIYVKNGSFFQIMNMLERTFVRYSEMEKRLQSILYADSSLNDICRIILEYFGRPVFVHDEHFYILSCPEIEPEKTKFDYDSQRGSYMQDE